MPVHNVESWSKSDIVHRLAQFARSAQKRRWKRDELESALEGELARRVGLHAALKMVNAEVEIIHDEINAAVAASWRV